MTFTKETDCSAINLFDDELTTFYDAGAPSTTTITLDITYNCGTTPISITIDELGDLAYADSTASFVIDPTALSQNDSTLDDGIYHIELTIVKDTGEYYNAELCVAIVCIAACDSISYLANNLSSDIHKYVVALEDWVNNCDACDCSKACIIYKYLRKILDDEIENPCNCN